MKKNFIALAFAGVLLFGACETLEYNSAPQQSSSQEQMCTVTVSADGIGAQTKALNISEGNTGEKKVSNMQVFVFKGNLLMAYKKVTTSSATVECIPGNRTICLVLNAPDISVTYKTDLLATVSDLSVNTPTNLVMYGEQAATIAANATVNVQVKRLAARVHLSSITRAFSFEKLQGVSMTIDKVYMVNVAKTINYGQTTTPAAWYNQAMDKGELSAILSDTVNQTLANGATNSTGHWFYIYPNDPAVSHTTTRIVIETTLGGEKCYYPIDLPALAGNQSYEISKIKLTSPGGDNPNTPVTNENITFNFTVVDWSTIAVEELAS